MTATDTAAVRVGAFAMRAARVPVALVLLGLAAFAAAAATADPAVLSDLGFTSLPGNATELELVFDGAPPQPTSYTIEQPARIVLDLDGTKSELDSKYHSLEGSNTRSVTVIDTEARTRVVINLTEPVPYDTHVDGDKLFVTVGRQNAGSGDGPVAQAVADRAGDATDVSGGGGRMSGASTTGPRIENIDFRRGEQGEGRVLVELSDPEAPVDVRSQGGNIRVEIAGTNLPRPLRRRLDVADFATPVKTIDAVEKGGGAVLTIRPEGAFDYMAYQADDKLSVNVRPVRSDEKERSRERFKYQGKKLSLNFQDIEVRSVLQLIADFTDLNLVASDTVSGRITLRLQNVPWDQALDIVLRTKGLDKRKMGNVLMVAPAAEIAAREKQQLDTQQQLAELAPLRTEFVQIRYASASEIVSLFESAGGGESGVLSERGSLIVDDRTNSLVITDTAEKLEEIRRILRKLDIPVRQVQIEARIVTANTNFAQEIGIRWGGAAFEEVGDNVLKIGGSRETLGEVQNGLDSGGQVQVSSPDDLAVDLGASNPTSSLAVGLTGSSFLLDLELSALASDGEAEIVSRPKVITADKQTATIASGTEIPYQEASSSGATSTSFKEAELALEVTPQITPDDRIIIDLSVTQDSVGQIFNGVPSIDTNEIITRVLVDNGETVVLGGIFETSANRERTKTPFLGDLPYVGNLFRRKVRNEDKQELLIFVTPRIIEERLSRR